MSADTLTGAAALEAALNDFDPVKRKQALAEQLALAAKGALPLEPEKEAANLHCHTFFSYNGYGYSPTALAWMAKKNGIKLLGMVDFDVLDGVDEFLQACDLAGVRGSTGMEMRVFVPEYADREINSPGEPGVSYTMGIGFTSSEAGEAARAALADMRARAEERNRVMVERINASLAPVCVDYDRDVLPLTPSCNATERHMLVAYTQAAGKLADPAAFWAEKLGLPLDAVKTQIKDPVQFQNTVRSKLMKRGGPGYAQPGPGTFPTLEAANAMIKACGALPCATWLDGFSRGEEDPETLLKFQIANGAEAVNIVPDRNWNIADPQLKAKKLQKLYDVVTSAQKLGLPLNTGTEMNAPGQKMVDDFDAPELAPIRQAILDGAYFVYGHTLMQRAAGLGFQTAWAKANFPGRFERIDYYTSIGRKAPAGQTGLDNLRALTPQASPAEFLNVL